VSNISLGASPLAFAFQACAHVWYRVSCHLVGEIVAATRSLLPCFRLTPNRFLMRMTRSASYAAHPEKASHIGRDGAYHTSRIPSRVLSLAHPPVSILVCLDLHGHKKNVKPFLRQGCVRMAKQLAQTCMLHGGRSVKSFETWQC